MPDQSEVIETLQEHVKTLVTRKWTDIERILDAEEEIKIGFAVAINDREAQSGEQAGKDKKVKTTISFSERYTDSTEATLDDPTQPSLFRQPSSQPVPEPDPEDAQEEGGRFTVTPPEGYLQVHHGDLAANDLVSGNGNAWAPAQAPLIGQEIADMAYYVCRPVERHAEAGDAAREDAETIATVKDAAEPIGTPVGAALDAAAVQTAPPRVLVDLPRGYTPAKYVSLFRKAATQQGWTEPQISVIVALCDETTQGENTTAAGMRVIDVLRSHSDPKPRKSASEPITPPAEAPPVADAMSDAPPGAEAEPAIHGVDGDDWPK